MAANEPTRALIVVDMQNAFIEPTAGAPVDGAAEVVRAVNARVEEYAGAGRPIFYTRDIDPTGRAHVDPGDALMHRSVSIRGTVVDKGPGHWRGFSGFVLASAHDDGPAGAGGLSQLAPLLRAAQVHEVEVVGLAADVCVASTAVDAVRLGFAATVDLGATAFVHAHPDGDAAAVDDLRAAGVTIVSHPHPE